MERRRPPVTRDVSSARASSRSVGFGWGDVTAIGGYVEVGADFAAGAFRHDHVASIIRGRRTFEPLGDVGHDRDGSPAHLVGEATIPRKRRCAGERVHLSREDASLLPGYEIFEPLDAMTHDGRA
jgi:hypothetical protein